MERRCRRDTRALSLCARSLSLSLPPLGKTTGPALSFACSLFRFVAAAPTLWPLPPTTPTTSRPVSLDDFLVGREVRKKQTERVCCVCCVVERKRERERERDLARARGGHGQGCLSLARPASCRLLPRGWWRLPSAVVFVRFVCVVCVRASRRAQAVVCRCEHFFFYRSLTHPAPPPALTPHPSLPLSRSSP